MRRVVITRPLVQARVLAERVTAIGREAVVLPLLEIHPLIDSTLLRDALDELTAYEMVAFVSPNAIDACFAELGNWPTGVAIAVVGEGSRAALASHGVHSGNTRIFSPSDPLRTDSETLFDHLDIDALRGKKVLIVRGETGRELLADALRAAGVQVVQVSAYRRVAPALDASLRAQLHRLLDTQNDWIVTSSEALRILMAMVEQIGGALAVAKIQQQHLIVPHARIAETAQMLDFQNITLTASGDERLLAALQSRT